MNGTPLSLPRDARRIVAGVLVLFQGPLSLVPETQEDDPLLALLDAVADEVAGLTGLPRAHGLRPDALDLHAVAEVREASQKYCSAFEGGKDVLEAPR